MNWRTRFRSPRAPRRAGRRGGPPSRRLGSEPLEPRLALSGQALATVDLLPTGSRPFPTGLEHVDPLVRDAIAAITTTAASDELAVVDLWPKTAAEGALPDSPVPSLIQSRTLIGLPSFQSQFPGFDGSGFSVVIIDSGIDLDHPFFGPDDDNNGVADRIVYNADFITGRPSADDFYGHGTHVSSIVASQDAVYGGMAPGANIIHLRVLNDSGSGSAAAIEAALQWVVANVDAYDIASVNLSLGFVDNHASPASRPELGFNDELAAITAQDVIVVSASGNGFSPADGRPGVSYPSADPNSLSIGAVWDADVGGPIEWLGGTTDYTTGADRVLSFSQRHPTMTTALAPGGYITAAAIGGGTVALSGTSMAAPHVAGLAAVMQQLAMQELGRRLTFSEFGQLIEDTGIPVVDGDDEDDNVQNTNGLYHRIDVLSMASAIISDGLGDLSIPTGLKLNSPTTPAGGIARLDFRIANQGLTSLAEFTGDIYLSTDEVIDSSDLLLTTLVDGLEAGGSLAFSRFAVQLPEDVAPGEYYVGVLLDQDSLIPEGNESNNSASARLTVTADEAEVWIYNLSKGLEVLDGVSTVDFGQIDQGAVAATQDFRIYNDGTVALTLASLNIPAGFALIGLPLTVPPRASADFTISLSGSSDDGGYSGLLSLGTNDSSENPFEFALAGVVDHGDSASEATTVSANTTVSGTIVPGADADWFQIEAIAGVTYQFRVDLGTLSDSVLRLIGVDGVTPLLINDDGSGAGSVIVWTSPADGVYFLEVRGKGANTGTYSLAISSGDDHGDAASSSSLVTDPSANQGVLESPGDVDWFAFEASHGTSYRLETTLSSLDDSILRLYSTDGTTELAVSDGFGPGGPSLIDWRAPDDGVYYLAVSAAAPQMIGAYELLITGEDDHGDNAPNASAVAAPSDTPGDVEESLDVDWFSFSTVAGADYAISLSLGNLNRAVIRLIDVNGHTELELASNPRPNDPPVINWTAPTSGVYYVEVRGLGDRTGSYSLLLDVVDDHGNDAEGATPTTEPSSTTGVLELSGDLDWFRLEAFAGVAYRIEAQAIGLPAASVRLIAPDGTTQLAAETGSSGAAGIIEWTASENGQYFIEIGSGSPGLVGDYELRIFGEDDHGDNLANATTVTVPNSAAGSIERSGDSDWFSLPTIAGLDYQVEVTRGTLAGASLRVLRSDGVTVVGSATAAAGSAVVRWTAATGGVYFIEVSGGMTGGSPGSSASAADEPEGEAESPSATGTYTVSPTLLSPIPGDYDGNLVVDGKDLLVWQRNYGAKKRPLDAAGFEEYLEGPLRGQSGWVQLGSLAGSAVVQSDVAAAGDQAVQVDRAAFVDNRWTVPLGASLPTGNVMLVTWDMRVTPTGNEELALGPFFGVEAYDDKGIFGLLGSLGVDATTLDILYQREDDGVLVEANRKVEPDAWNSYGLLFDFMLDQYTIYFNGEPLATTGFVDRGASHNNLDQFTDADISAIAAQANAPSRQVTGTAYFDNFVVHNGLPEQRLPGDGNNDGAINELDLAIWKSNFGLSAAVGSGLGGEGAVAADSRIPQSASSAASPGALAAPPPIAEPVLPDEPAGEQVGLDSVAEAPPRTAFLPQALSLENDEQLNRPGYRPGSLLHHTVDIAGSRVRAASSDLPTRASYSPFDAIGIDSPADRLPAETTSSPSELCAEFDAALERLFGEP